MATTGHFGEYDEHIRLLNEAMRYKLRVNAHKGFLGDLPPTKLLEMLKGEVAELEEAAGRDSRFEMLLEAADIANFALGFIIAATRSTTTEGAISALEPGKPLNINDPPFNGNGDIIPSVEKKLVLDAFGNLVPLEIGCSTCKRTDTPTNLVYTCTRSAKECLVSRLARAGI